MMEEPKSGHSDVTVVDPQEKVTALCELLYLVIETYGKNNVLEVDTKYLETMPEPGALSIEWHRVGDTAAIVFLVRESEEEAPKKGFDA